MELIYLKEWLYKDKVTSIKTLVGPPLTMLLITDRLLTVQQEIEASILVPADLIHNQFPKERKTQPSKELITGETS